jgi:RHS repeat-associated protein
MVLVLWLVLAMQTQTKAETTIHLDPGDDIAAANAQAQPGDTIHLAAGTFLFHGEIELKDDLTYEGTGAGQTILDGQNTPSAFVAFGSKGWVVDGLTIQNFKQPDDGYDGGVFAIYDSAEGIIKNCAINNCSASNAGVGDVRNSTLEVINSTINNCTAVNDGGVFGLYNSQLTMTDSYLSNISCGKDGGIFYASGGSRITIDKCQIYDCEAGENYALGYLSGDGASLDLSNSIIGNLNAVDDWLYMCFASDADHNRWWNNIIYGCNTASGIFLFQGPLEFLHNTLYDIHCNGKGFMALWTTQYSNNGVLSTISNNIFSACSNCIQEGCSTYYMITQRYPNTSIACGNVIYDFTSGMGDFFDPSILEENNLFGENPLLEDPVNGGCDLLYGSPATDHGCSVDVETDQDGNTRDDQPDSGALEIQDESSDTPSANSNFTCAGDGGDPVNTFTGGRFNRYPADLNLRGPMPLFFSRYYDSFIKSDGNITSSLGDNWLGNFDMTLTQNGSAVEVITNRGRLIQFEQNGASWDLTGKTDIAYQLVQSGTDFILGNPHTGRMYTFAQDLPNSSPDPLLIDDFPNPIPRLEAMDQDGTFPVTIGTTVEGIMLGGEFDVLLALDGVENSGDGAYLTVEQGRAKLSQDATSMGRALLIYDGMDGDAARVAASAGLGGGVDLTQGGTVDGIEIEVVRNDLPLKIAVLVFSGVENSSELTLDIPATDSPATFKFPFSDLTSLGESADLTRVTTVIVLVGALGSAVGPVHIEIDSIKMTSSGVKATPSDTTRKLAMIEDGKGNVHALTYGGDTLSSVSDGMGRTLNFTYTGDQLSSVDDGTRTITFNHTGNDLTGYTDSMGNTTTYTYATGGLMTAATRPAGNTHYSQTYDGDERVAIQVDALGNTNTFSYNSPDTVMTDPLSSTRTHTHSGSGELTGHQDEDGLSVSMGYDSEDRRNTITDRLGDTTAWTYHPESSKLASVTNADGTTTTYDYTARTHSSGIVFHDLTGITYPDGTTESCVYDSSGNMTSCTGRAGNVWSFTYNGNGQVLTVTNPVGGITTNTYNTDSTLASHTDPAGNTTTFGYNSLRRLNLITHADGTAGVYTYDDNGNFLTVTDERGNTTTFAYDDNDNLTTLTDPLGNTTTFAYDGMDRIVSVTDPLGNIATCTYDEMERLSTATDRNGNTTTFAYDGRGRLISITDGGGNVWSRTHDAESIIASATDPLSNATTYVSDNMGRMISATSPLSNVTSVTYDPMGRMMTVRDPLGETTTRTYDARGLTSDITLPDSATASYARDELGRIIGITDPEGNNWQCAYDSQGRLTSTTDPIGNITTYQYDSRNRVSLVDLPEGDLELTYDDVGNITRRLYSDGTDLNYTFDALNRLTGADGLALGYDANGRITSSNGLTITRDAGGRIATMTMAPGKTITYTYDSLNRLTEVADWLGGTTTFAYDDAGRLASIARPNGVTTSYTYDNDSRLTGIAEGAISNIVLTRDGKGQITAATRDLPLVSQLSTYTYDSVGRLTGDGTRSYTWDRVSRMTSRTEGANTVTFTYDAASQLSTHTYDSMGRLIEESQRTYTWNQASQMMTYTEGAGTVTFTYDALGHRISRTEGDTTRSYVWNCAFGLPSVSVEIADVWQDPIIPAVDLNGDGIVDFADMCIMADNWGTDEPSCDIGPTPYGDGIVDFIDLAVLTEYWLADSPSEGREGEDDVRYYIYTPDGSLLYSLDAADDSRRDYHYDEMGNTSFLTDNAGAVIGSYAYSPFGQLIFSTGDLDNSLTWQGLFGVTGEANGLYYMRARYYDSATGRFISRDPLNSISPKSLNSYQYALSNPMRHVSPRGLNPDYEEGADLFINAFCNLGSSTTNKREAPMKFFFTFTIYPDSQFNLEGIQIALPLDGGNVRVIGGESNGEGEALALGGTLTGALGTALDTAAKLNEGAPIVTKAGKALGPIGLVISDAAEIVKANERMDEIEIQWYAENEKAWAQEKRFSEENLQLYRCDEITYDEYKANSREFRELRNEQLENLGDRYDTATLGILAINQLNILTNAFPVPIGLFFGWEDVIKYTFK